MNKTLKKDHVADKCEANREPGGKNGNEKMIKQPDHYQL